MNKKSVQKVLKDLGITALNAGASDGSGRKLTSKKAVFFTAVNPATSAPLAKVQLAGVADVRRIVSSAQQTFLQWRLVPAPQRGALVRQIGEALRTYKHQLAALITLEAGKIPTEAAGEVQEMIDMADFAVGLSRMLYGKTMPSERRQHRLSEQWHPLGPIGVITAFNFPVAVWAWNAFIAAVCGNTVIWKPSRKGALCAIAVQRICEKVAKAAGFPGIFSFFIPERQEIATEFVADTRLPLISFTGSIAVGQQINQIVARRFGRTLLELSGNNAVIVDETARLSSVIPAVVFGAVGTAGQRCTTIRRLIVPESRYEEVVRHLIQAYRQIKIGNPAQRQVLMGPLIDQAAVTAYQQALREVKQMGGKILYGGRVLKRKGYFVEPTLVLAENHWPIVQQETFAPILYLIRYRQFSQAIALQNAVPQGLSSALFTEKLAHAEAFLAVDGSDCGIANINTSTSGAEIGGAFGGEKATGGGREAGSDAWKNYMRRQTNTIHWGEETSLAQGIQFKLR